MAQKRWPIIAQYMVKTKFGDALKILVAREKMATRALNEELLETTSNELEIYQD